MLRPADLRGKLLPAVPVPLAANGQIHAEAQARYVEYMAAQPAGGVAVWAHTGRGLWLESEQRTAVLRSWREGLGPGRIVVAGAGCTPRLRAPDDVMRSARAMAQHAADLGADAVLVFPPVAFRGHASQDRLVLEYHAAVAEAGLPLILFYLYETAGGISYGPAVLAQLLARPDVLGIKVATLDSVMTFQQIATLVQERYPDKLLISGEDRFLGYSFLCGADSALVGMGAACTALQCALLSSHQDADWGRFVELNQRVDTLGRHTFYAPMEGYVGRMLWCLVHLGVIPAEAAHDPWGPPIGPGEVAALRDCLVRIGEL